MPICWHPCTRAINPNLAGTDSLWAPTMDHILPRALDGLTKMENLRAAHAQCNNWAGKWLRITAWEKASPNTLSPADILGTKYTVRRKEVGPLAEGQVPDTVGAIREVERDEGPTDPLHGEVGQ